MNPRLASSVAPAQLLSWQRMALGDTAGSANTLHSCSLASSACAAQSAQKQQPVCIRLQQLRGSHQDSACRCSLRHTCSRSRSCRSPPCRLSSPPWYSRSTASTLPCQQAAASRHTLAVSLCLMPEARSRSRSWRSCSRWHTSRRPWFLHTGLPDIANKTQLTPQLPQSAE